METAIELVTLPGLFTDGGMIGPYPWGHGGTWAYTLVDKGGVRIRTARGLFLPSQAEGQPVENNMTELAALVYALEGLPMTWVGSVYCDNKNALNRVFAGWAMRNVPEWLQAKVVALRENGRLQGLRPVLLGGHPTKADLARGYNLKGLPVSEHNVYVDELCGELAELFLSGSGETAQVLAS